MTRRLAIALAAIFAMTLSAGCANDHPAAPAEASRAAIDTAPPAPPSQLVCRNDDGDVKVAWRAEIGEPDFAGFKLYRTGAGGTVVLIGQPTDVDRFVDTHPFEGVAVYAVTAVDQDGNESAAATVVHDYFGVPAPSRAIH